MHILIQTLITPAHEILHIFALYDAQDLGVCETKRRAIKNIHKIVNTYFQKLLGSVKYFNLRNLKKTIYTKYRLIGVVS